MSIESVKPSYSGVAPVNAAQAGAPLQRFVLNGPTMGTRYAAIFFALADIDRDAVAIALQSAVDQVDNQMSTWKPESDLSRFNALEPERWMHVPADLVKVVSTALEIGRASNGAFDVGVGELVDACGFGPAGPEIDVEKLDALAASKQSAAEAIEVDETANRLLKTRPVSLDLSGIAKGFGVDQLADCLDGFGITSYLVSIDGEIRAQGAKADGKPWIVAIERPDPTTREIARRIEITDLAIATSGDYRHTAAYGEQQVSHTMDPRTGCPLLTDLASVTVVAESCMRADAWATALMVLGQEEGAKIAQSLDLDALFMVRDGDGFREVPIGRLA